MKTKQRSVFSLLTLVTFMFVSYTLAVDNPQLNLPEGAIARLGKGQVNKITYSPDGTQLAVASTVGIWIYDTETLQAENLLTKHIGRAFSIAYSPDSKTIAAVGDNYAVEFWDTITGGNIKSFKGHTELVWSAAFSPKGNTLVTGGGHNDPTVRLWDVKTGASLYVLSGHTSVVNDVAFSPNGKTIASGCWDKTVRLWDVATGTLKSTFTGHSERVRSVSFSPDGKTIASGSDDHTIRLWDVATGNQKNILTEHPGSVLCIGLLAMMAT